jgi:hypothetical protein
VRLAGAEPHASATDLNHALNVTENFSYALAAQRKVDTLKRAGKGAVEVYNLESVL